MHYRCSAPSPSLKSYSFEYSYFIFKALLLFNKQMDIIESDHKEPISDSQATEAERCNTKHLESYSMFLFYSFV